MRRTTIRLSAPAVMVVMIILGSGCLGGCEPGNMTAARPEDDQYTILLLPLGGPDHIEVAEFHRKRAKKYTGWQGLYVVNKENHSGLYWGRYRTQLEAMKKLRIAKRWPAPATKELLFQKAIIVRLPGKDIGPAEWNLKNAKGFYSVLVAVFFDIEEQNYYGRKRRAVELCEKLREEGKVAYFYHGLARSGVAIGMFPRSAIRIDQVTIIHPTTRDRSLQERKTIVDLNMKQMLRDYPELIICGNTESRGFFDPKKGTYRKQVQSTYPFKISGVRKGQSFVPQHSVGNP